MNRSLTIKLDGIKQEKFEITPQGFLISDARITRAGVFDYHDTRGHIREFRSPEEVFNEDSIKSLTMIPITRHHPDVMIDSGNVKKYQVGMVGENITRDKAPEGDFVKCKVIITDKGEVDRIIKVYKGGGDVELSCGYTSDVSEHRGTHPVDGEYDAVQTNIRYNHLSIVDRGRAGRDVKLNLDRKGKDMKTFTKSPVKLDSFQMDAITGEIGEDSGLVVSALSSKLDDAVGVISKLEQDAKDKKVVEVEIEKETKKKEDELQGKVDGLETELKAAKEDADLSLDSPKVREMFDEYGKVTSVAMALEIPLTKKDDDKEDEVPKTIKELRVDIISKHSPEFKADGKSDDYISARFDTVVDTLKADVEAGHTKKLGTFVAAATKVDVAKDPKKDFMDKCDAMHSDKE